MLPCCPNIESSWSNREVGTILYLCSWPLAREGRWSSVTGTMAPPPSWYQLKCTRCLCVCMFFTSPPIYLSILHIAPWRLCAIGNVCNMLGTKYCIVCLISSCWWLLVDIKPGDTHHGHKAAALRGLQHYCPRYCTVLFVFCLKVCIVVHCLGQCLISEVIEPQLLQPSNPHPLTIVALYLDLVFNSHLQRTSSCQARRQN